LGKQFYSIPVVLKAAVVEKPLFAALPDFAAAAVASSSYRTVVESSWKNS